jgi:hypothetical protein
LGGMMRLVVDSGAKYPLSRLPSCLMESHDVGLSNE